MMISSVAKRAGLRATTQVSSSALAGVTGGVRQFALRAYNEANELALKQRLSALPAPGKAFVTAEGAPRPAKETELSELAEIAALYKTERVGLLDMLFLGNKHARLYRENTALLKDYYYNGRRILDKIPVKDKQTGKVTWEVKREGAEKEDWVNQMYYFYAPSLILLLVVMVYKSREDITFWAKKELDQRVLDQHPEIADAPESERDALIVERIIAGDYDKLASLQKKATPTPATLI